MEGKNKIIIYRDWLKVVEKLKDNQAGQLFKHFLRYVNDENPQAPSPLIDLVFEPWKQQLKRDLKNWEQYVEKQKENGAKGGRPKNKKEPKKPKPFSENPTKPKKPDTDTVTDTVTVTEKEIYREFAHLKITTKEVSKLLDAGFTMQEVDDILDAIQNYKNNQKYISLYLTAKKWLKKDQESKVKNPSGMVY